MNRIFEIQGPWTRHIKKAPRRGRPNIYPFKTMGVGHQFIHGDIGSAIVLANYWRKKLGHRYDITPLGVGACVRRVA